ncbi:MAG: glucoamylase family protein [Armatimonadota bacterium]
MHEIERRAFRFFLDHTHPKTGLVRDRARNFSGLENRSVASAAATGFGLAAVPIGVKRGWITRSQGQKRALTALRFLLLQAPNERGFFYHFMEWDTGRRVWNSEASSIDSALLFGGALAVGEYYGGEVRRLAYLLLERADFRWMLTDDGAKPTSLFLCHGWTPEGGFLPHRWDTHAEQSLLYLLAIGAERHRIPGQCWDAVRRPIGSYAGLWTFYGGPLFIHQFSHAFVDFRGVRDRKGYDYWQASVNASLINRRFCMDQSGRYRGYGPDSWGLSASDCVDGYHVHGAPPGWAGHDGTICPDAALASMPFTPNLCVSLARHLLRVHGGKLWGRYGFSDAFSVDRNWWGRDVVGIDVGCMLLMIENRRSGLVWKLCGKSPVLKRGMKLAGLRRAVYKGSGNAD